MSADGVQVITYCTQALLYAICQTGSANLMLWCWLFKQFGMRYTQIQPNLRGEATIDLVYFRASSGTFTYKRGITHPQASKAIILSL